MSTSHLTELFCYKIKYKIKMRKVSLLNAMSTAQVRRGRLNLLGRLQRPSVSCPLPELMRSQYGIREIECLYIWWKERHYAFTCWEVNAEFVIAFSKANRWPPNHPVYIALMFSLVSCPWGTCKCSSKYCEVWFSKAKYYITERNHTSTITLYSILHTGNAIGSYIENILTVQNCVK
jgi:hypothetical protein